MVACLFAEVFVCEFLNMQIVLCLCVVSIDGVVVGGVAIVVVFSLCLSGGVAIVVVFVPIVCSCRCCVTPVVETENGSSAAAALDTRATVATAANQ